MSNWLVAIVGGTIATVAGGLILFYLLPPQLPPGWSSQAVGPPARSKERQLTGLRQLKCTMREGVMDGHVYSFSLDLTNKKGVWVENKVGLSVEPYEGRTRARAKVRIWDWPAHDEVLFEFSLETLAVDGRLLRDPTYAEILECRERERERGGGGMFCDLLPVRVGEPSNGKCREIARAF